VSFQNKSALLPGPGHAKPDAGASRGRRIFFTLEHDRLINQLLDMFRCFCRAHVHTHFSRQAFRVGTPAGR